MGIVTLSRSNFIVYQHFRDVGLFRFLDIYIDDLHVTSRKHRRNDNAVLTRASQT